MSKIFLICDESGAKGFSDNQEQHDGQFGIMAGYFLNDSNKDELTEKFGKIYSKYQSESQEKLHITDLTPEQQESLRNDVFDCFRENNIEYSYEAIYVQGYYESYETIRKITKKCEERLHSELFQGLFGKSIAYFMSKYDDENIEIEVVTDTIDDGIKKEFEQRMKELIKPFPFQKTLTSFDKEKQEVKKYSLQMNCDFLNDEITKTKSDIKIIDNELTLIADVLVNSLHYYIKQNVHSDLSLELNSPKAITTFPISCLAYGLSTPQEPNIMSDRLFKRREK